MIYLDSRYAEGRLVRGYNTLSESFQLTVFRVYPEELSEIYYYEWVEGDRIDMVSAKLLGDPEYWWKIMDFNPEIHHPFEITPGTLLRIPSGI